MNFGEEEIDDDDGEGYEKIVIEEDQTSTEKSHDVSLSMDRDHEEVEVR
jgi:hypothetical protein